MTGDFKTWTREQTAAISSSEIIATRDVIVERIRPLLADHNPIVQGLVLSELVAVFLAGHPPELRPPLLRMLVKTIEDLTPIYADELDSIREDNS